MEPVSLQQVAAATSGRLARAADPAAPVGPDVVTDSRAVTPGALFVAFLGERVDGHDYLDAAASAGAVAALVDREVDADLPQVVVPDTVAALALLARDVVTRAEADGLVVVGITGSSGKTSTKDLLAQVLADAAPTIAPPGSFNNEIGAPLTACRVGADTRFLVSEMGARGPGHIRALAEVMRPGIGAVLNVGHAHLGEFGSVEGIALAKGELVEALAPEGWAVLNADDPRVIAMALRTGARLAAFSSHADPVATDAALRVWAADVRPDDLQRFSFTLHAAGAVTGSAPVSLRVLGVHQVDNALAAAAIALAAGLPLEGIAASLSAATPLSRWRMELVERADGLAILNDAYNANPDSMAVALSTAVELRQGTRAEHPDARVIAVLGDMLELGPLAPQLHEELGRLAADLGISEVVAVGDLAGHVVAGAAAEGLPARVSDRENVAGSLSLGPGDVVLIKGSRGVGLETVAAELADGNGGVK